VVGGGGAVVGGGGGALAITNATLVPGRTSAPALPDWATTVPGTKRLVDLYLTVQRRPRRDRAVSACPAFMPTSLGTVAVRTVVEGGAVVVGAGRDVVAVAAWPHPETSPTASSSAPMLPEIVRSPLR
jgi:hypothetical protein